MEGRSWVISSGREENEGKEKVFLYLNPAVHHADDFLGSGPARRVSLQRLINRKPCFPIKVFLLCHTPRSRHELFLVSIFHSGRGQLGWRAGPGEAREWGARGPPPHQQADSRPFESVPLWQKILIPQPRSPPLHVTGSCLSE